ncbi:MAG: adenylate/guanylate cyclase domain-containing protein [Rhodothermales bacterium]
METPTKILLVDDEPDLGDLIRQKFRKEIRAGAYEFVTAHDGYQALEALQNDPDIEIVLTDINMPRMDGLTLLTHIRRLERLLQAVVISAYGDLDNIRQAMNRGSFDFLMKPIDLLDLEITIKKAIQTVEERRRAVHVRETFGRYLSDEVASALLDDPDAWRLGGEKRLVTILMSDLRGFSNVSERLAPEVVVDILNTYLGRMAEVIAAYQGTIDEFIGDAILVIFGAPLQRPDDASRAVACALAMQRAMEEVNAVMAARGWPALEMGIGINTGEVVVGNIGSRMRAKYGVVGSHVNLTARIESYTVGGQVLIAEGTRSAVGGALAIGRRMQVSTKGFSEPVAIYEVEGIGAPFNLSLETHADQLATLAEPVALRCTVLDGKHMTGAAMEGDLLALSGRTALIRLAEPLDVLVNLRIELDLEVAGARLAGDLYAKTTEVDAASRTATLRFTAIPEDVAAALRVLADAAPHPR